VTITEERLVELEAIAKRATGQGVIIETLKASEALPDLLKEIRRLQGCLSEAERMREWWKASAGNKGKSREYWEGRFRDLRELYGKALEQIKEANEKIVALQEKSDYEEAHTELKGDYDVLKEQAKELAKHGQAYFDAVSEWAELLDEILDKVRQAPNEDAIRVLQRFIKQCDLLDDVEPLFEKALANLPPSLRGDE